MVKKAITIVKLKQLKSMFNLLKKTLQTNNEALIKKIYESEFDEIINLIHSFEKIKIN